MGCTPGTSALWWGGTERGRGGEARAPVKSWRGLRGHLMVWSCGSRVSLASPLMGLYLVIPRVATVYIYRFSCEDVGKRMSLKSVYYVSRDLENIKKAFS